MKVNIGSLIDRELRPIGDRSTCSFFPSHWRGDNKVQTRPGSRLDERRTGHDISCTPLKSQRNRPDQMIFHRCVSFQTDGGQASTSSRYTMPVKMHSIHLLTCWYAAFAASLGNE